MARKAEPMFELFNIRESRDSFVNPDFSLPDPRLGSAPLDRFLFDPVNRKFLKPDGQWTSSEADAMNFADMQSVAQACSKYGVRKGEVLLRNTQNVEFRLPLRLSRQ